MLTEESFIVGASIAVVVYGAVYLRRLLRWLEKRNAS